MIRRCEIFLEANGGDPAFNSRLVLNLSLSSSAFSIS